jgi:hypothetical protein
MRIQRERISRTRLREARIRMKEIPRAKTTRTGAKMVRKETGAAVCGHCCQISTAGATTIAQTPILSALRIRTRRKVRNKMKRTQEEVGRAAR